MTRTPSWIRRLFRNHVRTTLVRRPAARYRLAIEGLEDRTMPSSLEMISTGVLSNPFEGNGDSFSTAMSADGQYVVFSSTASNLVPGDTNNASDVFRKDLLTGSVVLVSANSSGTQGNAFAYGGSISADGRYVAFISDATNLVPGDTNGNEDVFRKDLLTGAITRVNTNSAGTQGNGFVYGASISTDGRYIAFSSNATNLVSGDTNGEADAFRKDLLTGDIIRVNTNSAGAQGSVGPIGNDDFYGTLISADGRYVAFSNEANNLVQGDINGSLDVFRKDLTTGEIILVSTSSAGMQGNSGAFVASISSDGRYVVFSSNATNLVPGDMNGQVDVFRKDLQTGEIILVSTNSAGTQGNAFANGRSISADGRYVAFISDATNLVPGDTNESRDIFRKDLLTGAITRVNTNSAGTQGNAFANGASISADGRFVAFSSDATNLVSGDTNNFTDVFRKDLNTGDVVRASTPTTGGTPPPNGTSYTTYAGDRLARSVSEDGRYVVFSSDASNIVSLDTNGQRDIFRTDRLTGQTVLVSTTSTSNQGNGNSLEPSISADGRYVVFESDATNLVPGDTNGLRDIFRKDLVTGVIVRVSTDTAGNQGTEAPGTGGYGSTRPSISADGRYVAFQSSADNLVPGDTNIRPDVFRKDLATGETIRASTDMFGNQTRLDSASIPWLTVAPSEEPSISADGRYIAFSSYATNLVPGGTNGQWHVFRKDLLTGEVVLGTSDSFGNQATSESHYPSLSADGRYVVFLSLANNLVPGDTNNIYEIFRKDLLTGQTIRVSTNSAGEVANNSSFVPTVSADGRFVAFYSFASNLVPGDTNGHSDVFRKDLLTGEVIRVSSAASGAQGDSASTNPAISGDGRNIVFASTATNLVPGGTPFGLQIVYLWSGSTAPTDLTLSNSSVNENAGPNAVVGTLSATDADPAETFTFSLVPGAGDSENAFFNISGNQLRANASFDFETRSNYSVRIRVTDSGGLTREQVFAITVSDVAEVTGFDVQKGQTQRSFVRYVDVTMDTADNAAALLGAGRVQLLRYDLQGNNPLVLSLAGVLGTNGNDLTLDFGQYGIGGNRNSTVGDGYYQLKLDTDGDGTFDTTRSFYRLFGDTNGDRVADAADVAAIQAAIAGSLYSPELDINGDGYVNATDRALAQRFVGRALASGLQLDD